MIFYDYYADVPPEVVDAFVGECELGRLVTASAEGLPHIGLYPFRLRAPDDRPARAQVRRAARGPRREPALRVRGRRRALRDPFALDPPRERRDGDRLPPDGRSSSARPRCPPTRQALAAQQMRLLARYQPEGGFSPVTPESPHYRGALATIRAIRLDIQNTRVKFKLAQNRTPQVRANVIRELRKRGRRNDARAADLLAWTIEHEASKLPAASRAPHPQERSMTPHDAIRLFTKTLENLEKWMDKASESAKARSFEVDVLAQARLAPNQFAFVQQVQSACDQAKYAAAYLGGKAAAVASRHGEDVRRAPRADPQVHGLPRHRPEEGLRGRRGAEGRAALARRPLAHRARLPRGGGRPELLLPRDDGLRHPASQRRRARQDGLHRRASDAGGLSGERRGPRIAPMTLRVASAGLERDRMTLQVVGAGLGRTGTLSLKLALEKLLGGPCYHMVEVFAKPEHVPVWHAAARGEMVDWSAYFAGYRASVDWPAASFWREITAAFPDALVLLSVRDPSPGGAARTRRSSCRRARCRESGARCSTRSSARASHPISTTARPASRPSSATTPRCDAASRASACSNGSAAEGWAPLCAALGVSVPSEPFPRVNTSEEFLARFNARPLEFRRGPDSSSPLALPGRLSSPPDGACPDP